METDLRDVGSPVGNEPINTGVETPFSLPDRLPIATTGEAPLACPNTQIQRPRTREEIEMEGLRPCLDVLQKKIAMESYEFEVLNEVYLQNFLHR